jgi:Fe2+ or Zn2+ uptake regulation protein
MTTAELRARVGVHDARFEGLHIEAVYRSLNALARRGVVLRIRHAVRRHVYWAHSGSPVAEELS